LPERGDQVNRVSQETQVHYNYFAGITRSTVDMGKLGPH
jgi:hypothetical protein